eukprot:TRINITY_DN1197_c0_g1_i1.p1 TRINITY_DN1197_c0_g1~~TRINITY_DN1197_c0_g1_i1.p1  ORF type:complete len:340 (+),score=76.13 TRINITY_DN1197_c0_g1_i1:73-1092(+)
MFSKQKQLLEHQISPYFDIAMPGYEVPLLLDSFICANMTFPISDVKYHIVAVEPLIRHSTALSLCAWSCQWCHYSDGAAPDGSWECTDMTGMADCQVLPLIWTQGQPLFTLAPNVGIPLGMDGLQNVVLQMHNNNPTFEREIYDFSGLRLYYTDELREDDAGVILFGNNAIPEAIIVPPGQAEVVVSSDCPGQCTRDYEPVTVFSFHWHMHQVGRSATFHHIRDGTEIRNFEMPYWDYNWQGFYEIEPFEILPGDRVYTECIYQTMNRTETTYGGEGTQDEMCFFYLSVYPIQDGFGYSCLGMEMPQGDGFHTTLCGQDIQTLRFEEYEEMAPPDFCVI